MPASPYPVSTIPSKEPATSATKPVVVPPRPLSKDPEQLQRTSGPTASPKLDDMSSAEKTTVMLRNIPAKFTQSRMLHEFDARGFGGSYDFFYLPIDFAKRQNMSYCFVNFREPARAKEFAATFRKLKIDPNSSKKCESSFARVQGRDANVEMYRNSPIAGVPVKAYRPLVFGPDGKEEEFPAPDVPVEFLPPVQLRDR